jgi:hypothetical protein
MKQRKKEQQKQEEDQDVSTERSNEGGVPLR